MEGQGPMDRTDVLLKYMRRHVQRARYSWNKQEISAERKMAGRRNSGLRDALAPTGFLRHSFKNTYNTARRGIESLQAASIAP